LSNTDLVVKRRNPWLAGLLTLLSIPVGYMYVGRWTRIPIVFALFVAVYGGLAWTKAMNVLPGFVAAMVLMTIVNLAAIIDAILLARRQSDFTLRRYNRWYYYVLIFVITVVGIQFFIPNRGAIFGYEPYRMPANSMMPTLLEGDFFVVDTWHYSHQSVARGDIIVFDFPKNPKVKFAKRVIGLPGDHISYKQRQLTINGKPVEQISVGEFDSNGETLETLQQKTEQIDDSTYNIVVDEIRPDNSGEFIVPQGQYFVMGDNRDNSNDSRYWGYLPQKYICGKILYIWLSYSHQKRSFRAERIGMRVDQHQ